MNNEIDHSAANALAGLFISTILSIHGFKGESLSASGALTAFLVGIVLFTMNPAMGWMLIIFYLLGSRVSKVRHEQKKQQEELIKSQRNAWQVIGCSVSLLYSSYLFSIPTRKSFASIFSLASMGCCLGDTFASEIGSVFASREPILITTLERVPPGTNGAISLVGTLASILGGALMGLSFQLLRFVYPLYLYQVPPSGSFLYTTVLLGGGSGFVGSLIDSLLGATLQETRLSEKSKKIAQTSSKDNTKHISGMNLLSNEAVNLLSSLVTGFIFASLSS